MKILIVSLLLILVAFSTLYFLVKAVAKYKEEKIKKGGWIEMEAKMGWEKWAYWFLNVCSLGSLWLIKIVMKKAILEAESVVRRVDKEEKK
jgi:hypothetical protein